MAHSFTLLHIGINTGSPEEAEALSAQLSAMFNLNQKLGNKSDFAGKIVECMKSPFLGKNGHIALGTDDLAGAVEELKAKGCGFREETAAYTDEGRLKNIYLDGEFGGFAIHIMQM